MRTCSIYVLLDENDKIRYVGRTFNPLYVRLSQHIYRAKKGDSNHKDNWIRQMMRSGYLPKIRLIEIVDESCHVQKEIEWITFFRNLKLRLVNQTNGGEGHDQTEETKLKISSTLKGTKFSKERRIRYLNSWKNKKMSRKAIDAARLVNTGRVHTPEQIEKIRQGSLGRKHTEEAKEKLRIFHTGRHPSPETLEKLRISHMGKKRSPESLKKLSISLIESWKKRRLNKEVKNVD